MPTRREFVMAAIPFTAVGAACEAESPGPTLQEDGVSSAATKEALKKSLPFASLWKEATFAERQFLFALVDWPVDSESYIDLHGWIYNKSFQEWRRVFLVKTRHLGKAELSIDETKGVVSIRGAANNALKKQEVFRFDLRATSDDAAYVR